MLTEIRLAFRVLLRSPTFSFISISVLAFSLGAGCSIFSIVQAVLLRQLPYREPDRLIKIWETSVADTGRSWVSPANFSDWRQGLRSFEGMAAFVPENLAVAGQGEPRLVHGASISPDLPALLGVTPVLGRGFTQGEDLMGSGRVLLVGEDYWRRELQADRGVIGRVLSIGGEPHTVVGILPSGFHYPGTAEMWRPLAMSPEQWAQRGSHYLEVVARLRPGFSPEEAAAEGRTLAARLATQHPATNTGSGILLLPLRDDLVGEIRPALLVLMGAVAFVLVAASANLASLLLARVAARGRETAIRLALGASRFRLVRQLCTESVLLALIGGAIGLLLAHWGLGVILAFKPAEITQVRDVSLDAGVLGFGLIVSLATGLCASLAPALHASRQRPDASLMKEGERSGASRRSLRLQSLFVIGQITLALMLSIGAGLMSRSFGKLQEVEPGFDPNGVTTLTLTLPEKIYPDRPQQAALFKRLLERIEAMPATELAAVVSTLPLSGSSMYFEVTLEGSPAPSAESRSAGYDAISPDYFTLMRIPLMRGRSFTERDDTSAPAVCIVNETMARRFWPGRDPLGQRLSIGDWGPNPREVVGVIADVHHDGLDVEPRAEMYVPYSQAAWSGMSLVVRSRDEPARLSGELRRAIWAVDNTLPVSEASPMRAVLAASVSQRRFNMLLLGLFAALALVLAAMGLYGIMSHTVAERRREIGIRMTLGAGAADVRRLILGQGVALVLAGLTLGVPAALLLGRVLSHLLFGVSAADPLTFVAVSLALGAVALAAGYLPAARALRVDPMVSMGSR